MDINKLVEVLRATLQPDQREHAEQQLTEVHKIIGFVPTLLQVIMSDHIEGPIRQAAVIYLKNTIMSYWEEKEAANPTDPVPFSIHETDKAQVRDSIVEAVIHAPTPIRVQLAVCISHLVKHDFPGKWPGIAPKVAGYIESEQHETWMGALICLYQLVKNFEYKKPEERGALNQAMQVLLPMIHQRCVQLLPDESEASVYIQKQILKIFYALIQYFLPVDLITKQNFPPWMELVRQIVDRPVPPAAQDNVDEEERPELVWWKCKKWALHILARCFERYGSPGLCSKEYNDFADWYLKSFSAGILQVLLKLLDHYRQKHYVAPRVLQQTFNYLNQGVSHALCWKIMKPHMLDIVREIIFPLMCHSEEDELLWQSDPVEYIRVKYDVYEEFFSPVSAAQGLLKSAVSKRKEVLQKSMGFILQVLTTNGLVPHKKAGALHMVGTIADVLLAKKIYKDQAELMIVNHVFPAFGASEGYLRARACWVLHCFSEVKYKNIHNLEMAMNLLRGCVVSDSELPVKVEAAISIQMLLTEQEKAKDILRPSVREIIVKILETLRETENDDLTSVLQKLVCSYVDEVTPLAIDITNHLAHTFAKVLENEGGVAGDEKAIAAMGILNTLDTMVTVMEDQPQILQHIESIVLNVIGLILRHNVIEFYEELLSLIYSLTCQGISENMWNVFPMLYQLFKNDGFDYFTDMMPALHNYITVDPKGFSSNPKHLEIIYDMCKSVLTGDGGEDAECHAAKLFEVILLQYKGQVDSVIPSFVEVALERLTREVRTSELRTMCLQVVIAALYYDPSLLMFTLEKMCLPNSTETITGQFIKQWLHDCDCFLGLHDRRMCVLGLCHLINIPTPQRPPAVTNAGQTILPAMLMVFGGLKRAYEYRANNESDDSDEEDEEYNEELEDDDDEIDEDGQEYMEKLNKSKVNEDGDSDDDSDDDFDEAEITPLESYETPLDKDTDTVDEYQIFQQILENLKVHDPAWYEVLMGGVNAEQKKELQDVYKLAEQRRAAQESKNIEKKGGYVFDQTSVPTSFNFSSPQ